MKEDSSFRLVKIDSIRLGIDDRWGTGIDRRWCQSGSNVSLGVGFYCSSEENYTQIDTAALPDALYNYMMQHLQAVSSAIKNIKHENKRFYDQK